MPFAVLKKRKIEIMENMNKTLQPVDDSFSTLLDRKKADS